MLRIHIVGLPRSGTTALSVAVAKRLGLPLVVEPIFLWTDGFRVNLMRDALPNAGELHRVRNRIARLDQIFGSHGGFVEKTPSSVFFAPVLDRIVDCSIIVVVKRDRAAVLKSLVRKVFELRDGNVAPGNSLRYHNFLSRVMKTYLLFRTSSVADGISTLRRYSAWAQRNSILGISSQAEAEKYVDHANGRLDALEVGNTNRMIEISYDQFLAQPDSIIEEIAMFCAERDKEML